MPKPKRLSPEITKEFTQSWKSMFDFFENHQHHSYPMTEMLNLMKYLRSKGYISRLRAGQSHNSFILSRARYHGLASRQPHIRIMTTPRDDYCFQILYFHHGNKEEVDVLDCENYAEVIVYINKLLDFPVDVGEYIVLRKLRFLSPNIPNKLQDISPIIDTSEDTLRNAVIDLLYRYEMQEEDVDIARYLLPQETEWSSQVCAVNGFAVGNLADMISYFGSLEDLFLLWEMKYATFDMIPSIDASYFFGHGIAKTREFLQSSQHENAQDILDFIEKNVHEDELDEYTQRRLIRIHKHFSKD